MNAFVRNIFGIVKEGKESKWINYGMLKYIVFLLLFFEKIIIEILKVFMRISLSVYC